MAPPKRKTGGGRVTPKGTRPGGHPTKSTNSDPEDSVADWRRSSAPAGSAFRESKPWALPVAGVTLLGGVGLIVVYNLIDNKTPWMIGGALLSMMVGLWALTKW